MSNRNSPEYRYDPEYDTLELVLDEAPAYSDEIVPGVYIRYCFTTDEVVGATILSYSRHNNLQAIASKLPFFVELPSLKTLQSETVL